MSVASKINTISQPQSQSRSQLKDNEARMKLNLFSTRNLSIRPFRKLNNVVDFKRVVFEDYECYWWHEADKKRRRWGGHRFHSILSSDNFSAEVRPYQSRTATHPSINQVFQLSGRSHRHEKNSNQTSAINCYTNDDEFAVKCTASCREWLLHLCDVAWGLIRRATD